MPTYQFEAPDGSLVERDYPFGEAPHLGETVELDGVTCTRVISDHLAVAKRTVEPFTAVTLPPWAPGAPRYETDRSSPFYGQPKFKSRAEAEEFQARSGGRFTYDGLPPACEGRHRADQKAAAWDKVPVVDGDRVRPGDLAPDVLAPGGELTPLEELPLAVRHPRQSGAG